MPCQLCGDWVEHWDEEWQQVDEQWFRYHKLCHRALQLVLACRFLQRRRHLQRRPRGIPLMSYLTLVRHIEVLLDHIDLIRDASEDSVGEPEVQATD